MIIETRKVIVSNQGTSSRANELLKLMDHLKAEAVERLDAHLTKIARRKPAKS